MFHRCYDNPFIHQGCRVAYFCHELYLCGYFEEIEIAAAKDQSGVCGSWMQGQINRRACVQSDSRGFNNSPDSCLIFQNLNPSTYGLCLQLRVPTLDHSAKSTTIWQNVFPSIPDWTLLL